MSKDGKQRLPMSKKEELREQGWRHLNRKKAKRPSSVSRRKMVNVEDDVEGHVPTVKLDKYL